MTDEKNPAETGAEPAKQEGSDFHRKVDEVLDRIRPYVQMDGGHVELVNVNEEEGIVFIRFQGACSG